MCEGAPDAPLLLVAQSPGAEEVREGRPLIGLSGKILWKHAGQVGIHRENVRILNACCQIPEGGPSQAAPTKKQLAECAATFERMLQTSTPRVVLTLGGPALEKIMGEKLAIDRHRGYLLKPTDTADVKIKTRTNIGVYKVNKKCPACKGHGGCAECTGGYLYRQGDTKWGDRILKIQRQLPASIEWIIPTMHPASVHYNKYRTLPAFRSDLARVAEALQPEGVSPLPIEFDQNPRVLAGDFAFDVETTRAWDHITEIGMANAQEAWTSVWAGEAIGASRRMLETPGTLKIAHNLGFDYERLLDEGIEVAPPYFDTMYAFMLLQPDLFKGLDKVAPIYHPMRPWKHLAKEQPSLYNATDVVVTYALHAPLREDLEYTGMLPLFENGIMPVLPTLIRMKRNGLKVNPIRLQEWRLDLEKQENEALDWWRRNAGDVNPFSGAALQKYLYRTLGLPEQRNKYKQVTCDDTALTKLMGRGYDAVINTLRAIRKAHKLRRTYADVKLGADLRVHPSYLPKNKDYDEGAAKGFAASGRLASSDPNIQNQPKEARKLFVPAAGFRFLQADWKAAEVRVVAFLSNDLSLLHALATGDVHEQVRQALGCDRTRAKNVLFGTIYGAGPRTLAELLTRYGVPTTSREAGALQRKLAQTYRDLWAWRERVVEDGMANGYLTNAFGRRRYFYWPSEQVPEMIDFNPQSVVADCLWHVLRGVENAAAQHGGKLVASVHDSVLLEVPENMVMKTAVAVRMVMEQEWPQVAPGFKIPVEFDVSVEGTVGSWGNMERLVWQDEA